MTLRQIAITLAGGLLLTGCVHTMFEEDEDRAPVRVLKAPSDADKEDWGISLITLSRGGDSTRPRVVVVGGKYHKPISVLELNDNGDISRAHIPSLETGEENGFTKDPLGDKIGQKVWAMVQLQDATELEGALRIHRILQGVPDRSYVRLVRILIEDDGQGGDRIRDVDPQRFIDGAPYSGFGGGVAAGDFDGNGQEDWVVAADSVIFVAFDGDPHLGNWAEISGVGDRVAAKTRGLTPGRFFADGGRHALAYQDTPTDLNLNARVHLARWHPVQGFQPRALTLQPDSPEGEEPFFGRALHAVDLNGDDADDLIVSSPGPNGARLYFYLSTGDATGAELTGTTRIIWDNAESFSSSPDSWGASLLTLDLTGDGNLELAVGDPTATYSGHKDAGAVEIFRLTYNWNNADTIFAVDDPLVVGWHEPEADEKIGLGGALTALVWNTGEDRQELVVGHASGGIESAVLVFFLTGAEGDDTLADHGPRRPTN